MIPDSVNSQGVNGFTVVIIPECLSGVIRSGTQTFNGVDETITVANFGNLGEGEKGRAGLTLAEVKGNPKGLGCNQEGCYVCKGDMLLQGPNAWLVCPANQCNSCLQSVLETFRRH